MLESPESPSPETPGTPETAESETRRWPRVVGTIGIIAGVLMFLDKLDDVVMLPLLRSGDWWANLLGKELADYVMGWMPSTPWIVAASLIGMALGALLFVGGLQLRRCRRSGVTLCRTWSWLAIAWLLVEMSRVLWWFSGHADELRALAPGDWQGSAVFGILVALIVLAAFPVFLLSWFSRPAIRAQLAGWPQ